MYLVYEELARTHSAQLLREARREQRVNRVLAARRAQRRATAAVSRAHHLRAIALSG